MGASLTFQTTYEIVTCVSCGIGFAMPGEFVRKLRRSHATFYCPSGHNLWFNARSEEQKLRDELQAARTRSTHLEDQLEATKRSRAAARGEITKLRRRGAAGVCPFGCRRHFADLQRHVTTKHPGVEQMSDI